MLLGLTRSKKSVWLDRDSADSAYNDFTKDDHFDATCLWACYKGRDRAGISNLLGHGMLAGLNQLNVAEYLASLIIRGKLLNKRSKQHEKTIK